MSAAAVGAFGLAIALGTSACGAGQVSQTTSQEPAVNGGSAKLGALLIRDVTFVWPTDAEASAEAGGPYDIAFLISNESATVADKLVAVTPLAAPSPSPATPPSTRARHCRQVSSPAWPRTPPQDERPQLGGTVRVCLRHERTQSEAGDSDHLGHPHRRRRHRARRRQHPADLQVRRQAKCGSRCPNAGPDLERQDKVRGGEAGH